MAGARKQKKLIEQLSLFEIDFLMPDFNESKNWSDRFNKEIFEILLQNLGKKVIRAASDFQDMEEATDVIFDPIRVACRVRSYSYKNYKNDFTIRSERAKQKTEFKKIIEGYGDYIFYAISNENEDSFYHWFIGDLKVFRTWNLKYILKHKEMPGSEKSNKDGSSKFFVFNLEELPPDFVVAKKAEAILTTNSNAFVAIERLKNESQGVQ
jgi:hypothetical protein